MRIYVARHGEALDDIKNTYGGDADDPLTEKGKKQAVALAEKVKALGIEKIYCSPKKRACEAAQIIAERLQLPLEVVEDLRERNRYGFLTGTSKAEAAKKHPEIVEKLKHHRYGVEGGEEYEEFKNRIIRTLKAIAKKSPHEKILIVTHGGPIGVVFRELLGRDMLDFGHCETIALEHEDGKFKCVE